MYMGQASGISVLVIDDHPSVSEGVRLVLERSGLGIWRIVTADTAETALNEARAENWDLVITDLSLPGRHGTEFLGELLEAAPRARVLVYTMHTERQFGVRALRTGAHGYVTKDRPLQEVIAGARALLAGRRYFSAELADELVQRLQGGSGRLDALSDRELAVMRLFAQGLGVSEAADQLQINSKTVSTYRARILEKLQLKSTADIIRFAIENDLS